MANVYRANITSYEATANGTVNFDCWVELRTGVNPNFVWVPTSQGHFTIVLEASDVLAITQGAGTNAQKRQALETLIKDKALERGVDQADNAYSDFLQLDPPPFQVTIRN